MSAPAKISERVNIEGTAAFPRIFTADDMQGTSKPSYSIIVTIPKSSPQIEMLNSLMEGMIKKAWPTDWKTELKNMKLKGLLPLREGSLKSKYSGFDDDNMYVSARSPARPMILGPDFEELDEDDGTYCYSGSQVKLIVEFWLQQSKKYGNRINVALCGVQHIGDGEAVSAHKMADKNEFMALMNANSNINSAASRAGF